MTLIFALLSVISLVETRASPNTTQSNSRYVTFGTAKDRTGWVAVEVRSHAVQGLEIPEGFSPEYVAIAPAGQFVVFTAFDRTANNTLLFRLDRVRNASPVSIGDTRGYHASPTVSADGQWVLFAHHPRARGQPTAHEPQAYAQIYRVHPDGTGLEALTSGDGCHLAPSLSPSGDLAYVHTDCLRRRWFELIKGLSQAGQSPEVIPGAVNEPALSPDGMSVVFWVQEPNSVALYEMRLRERKPVLKAHLVPHCQALRPQFGATPGELLYQTGSGVWLLAANGDQRQIANFSR